MQSKKPTRTSSVAEGGIDSATQQYLLRSPLLGDVDHPWLQRITRTPLTPEFYEQANSLIAGDLPKRVGLREQRLGFFSLLGWTEESSSFHDAYQELLLEVPEKLFPLSAFVFANRILTIAGIDNAVALRSAPPIAARRFDHLLARITKIATDGFTPGSFCTIAPHSLLAGSQKYRDTVEGGVKAGKSEADIAWLFNDSPKDEPADPEYVRLLASFGHDPERIIRLGAARESAIETMRERLDTAHKLGLKQAVDKHPRLLAVGAEKLRVRKRMIHTYAHLLEWRGDPDKLAKEYPTILTVSDTKARFLFRFAQRFWEDPPSYSDEDARELTPVQVWSMAAALSVEGLLLTALSLRKADGPFIASEILTLTRKCDRSRRASERKASVHNQLEESEVRAWLGHNVVRSYIRYSKPGTWGRFFV